MKKKNDMIWLLIAMSVLLGTVFQVNEAMSEDRIKIGVIDTGVGHSQSYNEIICKNGVKSMIPKDRGYDNNGHGRNIIGLVSKGLDSKKYCVISYKVWNNKISNSDAIDYTVMAIRDAIKEGVGFLNISMSGHGTTISEYMAFRDAVKKMVVVVAAGNDGEELSGLCLIYPACYKRVIKKNFYVVGASDVDVSNYGEHVDYFTKGKNIGIPKKSGTSQATAYFMNVFIKKTYKSVVYKNRSLNVRFNFFRTTDSK